MGRNQEKCLYIISRASHLDRSSHILPFTRNEAGSCKQSRHRKYFIIQYDQITSRSVFHQYKHIYHRFSRITVVNPRDVVDFENVWIGARYSYGQWMWLSTGSILDTKTDDTGYPPWRFGRSEKNSGCILLDRHLENKPSFIEMSCDGKRDFVCEKCANIVFVQPTI